MKTSGVYARNWQIPNYKVLELKKKSTEYCICIPVLNEGEKIKKELKSMLLFSKMADIIIADWGSTDGSIDPDFLKRMNVRTLLTMQESGRQGSQLRMAFSYALKQGYQGIIQIDGNNKDGVEAIPNFIEELDDGFDYIQGSRFVRGGKAINTPLIRYLAAKFLGSPLLSLGAKYWYTDITNGFRGYSRSYLMHPLVQPFRDIFVSYELNMYLTVRANQLGLKTREIPVTRTYPLGKVPTKISFFRGNLGFLLSMIKAATGYYTPKI